MTRFLPVTSTPDNEYDLGAAFLSEGFSAVFFAALVVVFFAALFAGAFFALLAITPSIMLSVVSPHATVAFFAFAALPAERVVFFTGIYPKIV